MMPISCNSNGNCFLHKNGVKGEIWVLDRSKSEIMIHQLKEMEDINDGNAG